MTEEPDHGGQDESGTRYWCQSCKTWVPEFNWDFHERFHGPDYEPPEEVTSHHLGGGVDD